MLPNFLIVGAAKCGTTSLYHYLADHPDIFMPENKEPRFFVHEHYRSNLIQTDSLYFTNHILENTINSLEEYKKLFIPGSSYIRRGEASVAYLYYYETAIPHIKKYLGDIPIIIILRSPAERAFSAYRHLKRDLSEPYDFATALQKEEQRIQKNYIPLYRYVDQGRYSQQIKAYLENFSRVKIILFEDLKSHPLSTIQTIYSFLEVEKKYRPKNLGEKFNEGKIPRSPWIHQIIYGNSPIKKAAKFLFPKKIREKIKDINMHKPENFNEQVKILKNIFHDEIHSVEFILKKDLSSWY